MEPDEDLSRLLKEWEVSDAPPWLDSRVLAVPAIRRPRRRLAAAAAVLIALAGGTFEAGRLYQARREAVPAFDPAISERILRVAVADYLERSESVLMELANADPNVPLDISADRNRAHDLVEENRLYRQTAESTGQAAIASLLDDLERVLLEIEHSPAVIPPAELKELRRRLRDDGILFKMRVAGANVERL